MLKYFKSAPLKLQYIQEASESFLKNQIVRLQRLCDFDSVALVEFILVHFEIQYYILPENRI